MALTASVSRPRDTLWIWFLISYIPVVLLFDAISMYPQSLVPAPLLALFNWYLEYFNDQLMIQGPAWFRFFGLVEVFYQLPMAAWGAFALSRKSPKAPPQLLVWAVICCGTTMTCLFEFHHNELMSAHQKLMLIMLYGGYASLFGILAIDMLIRIQCMLEIMALSNESSKHK